MGEGGRLMRYTYRGDKMTDPTLKGLQVDPVKVEHPTRKVDLCVRGANGNMLVVDDFGRRHVVLGRQLRIN